MLHLFRCKIFYWKYFHFIMFGCAHENENAQIKPPIQAKHQSSDHHTHHFTDHPKISISTSTDTSIPQTTNPKNTKPENAHSINHLSLENPKAKSKQKLSTEHTPKQIYKLPCPNSWFSNPSWKHQILTTQKETQSPNPHRIRNKNRERERERRPLFVVASCALLPSMVVWVSWVSASANTSKERGRNRVREKNLKVRATPGGGSWWLCGGAGNLGLRWRKCERGTDEPLRSWERERLP